MLNSGLIWHFTPCPKIAFGNEIHPRGGQMQSCTYLYTHMEVVGKSDRYLPGSELRNSQEPSGGGRCCKISLGGFTNPDVRGGGSSEDAFRISGGC